jgi:hypothetical protein
MPLGMLKDVSDSLGDVLAGTWLEVVATCGEKGCELLDVFALIYDFEFVNATDMPRCIFGRTRYPINA